MFKRRSGLGGLTIVRGPMRRDDPATGAGAGGTGAAAGGGGGAPAPVTPPVAAPPAAGTPPVVDVTQTAEFKAALKQAQADAEAKARTGSKENARNDVLSEIATALGLKPKDVDPAQVGQELAAARTENASLKAQLEIGKAARKLDADEDTVAAVLTHKGALKDLDPTAADYGAKVEAAVKAAVDANPRLKNTPGTPARTPGTSGPAAGGMGNGAGDTARPSMKDAIMAQMNASAGRQ
jgi:hypothetical protein